MKLLQTTLCAAGAMLAVAGVARAQDMPFTPGNFSEVTDIMIDDGHFLDYMKFLDGEAKAEDDFAKSQGWLVDSKVYMNVHKRAGEADIYLMRTFKSMADPAEQVRRDKMMNEHFQSSDAKFEAESGERAKFRHIGSTVLLEEAIMK